MFSRLWRGAVFSLFLSPVLFLAAMGLGLGGLVDEHTGKVDGPDLPRLRRARAAGRERDADRGERVDVAGARRVKWVEELPRHGRDRDHRRRAARRLRAVDRAARDARRGRVPARRRAARRGAVGVGRARDPGRGAVRGRVQRAAAPRTRSTLDSDVSFPVIMRVGVLPLFLFSGTFFPISQLPDWLQPFARAVAAVARRRAGPRRDDRARSHLGADLVHVAVLRRVRRRRAGVGPAHASRGG